MGPLWSDLVTRVEPSWRDQYPNKRGSRRFIWLCGHVRRKWDKVIFEPGKESHQIPDLLVLGLLSLQNCEEKRSVTQANQSVVFCYSTLNGLRYHQDKIITCLLTNSDRKYASTVQCWQKCLTWILPWGSNYTNSDWKLLEDNWPTSFMQHC